MTDPHTTHAHIASIQIGRPLKSIVPVLTIARYLDIPVADPDDLHVTLTCSRHAVDWSADVFQPRCYPLIVEPQILSVAHFGDVAVLTFKSQALSARNHALTQAGARTDYDGYTPHITLSPWKDNIPLRQVSLEEPLVLGPEYRKPAKV